MSDLCLFMIHSAICGWVGVGVASHQTWEKVLACEDSLLKRDFVLR